MSRLPNGAADRPQRRDSPDSGVHSLPEQQTARLYLNGGRALLTSILTSSCSCCLGHLPQWWSSSWSRTHSIWQVWEKGKRECGQASGLDGADESVASGEDAVGRNGDGGGAGDRSAYDNLALNLFS